MPRTYIAKNDNKNTERNTNCAPYFCYKKLLLKSVEYVKNIAVRCGSCCGCGRSVVIAATAVVVVAVEQQYYKGDNQTSG